MDYDDFLGIEDIYTLLAISALVNGNYYVALKGFIKRELSENIPSERKAA